MSGCLLDLLRLLREWFGVDDSGRELDGVFNETCMWKDARKSPRVLLEVNGCRR